MHVALVGATGLVGRKMLDVLEERKFPVTHLIPVASERSVGQMVHFRGKDYPVQAMPHALDSSPDLALFSAGGSVSKEWAPKFVAKGTVVIDNSSAWRMDPDVPLVVPEVNAHVLSGNDRLIANPNCSTIQLVVALAPLHKRWNIRRLVISTYQSVTGTGKAAVDQYQSEKNGDKATRIYPHQIFENCLPQCDIFMDNGYTREEMKMVHETRKIMGTQDMAITATAVRVPVLGGHSESVNVEFASDFELDEIVEALNNAPGVIVQDTPETFLYPMALNAKDTDAVYVGRLRKDEGQPCTLNLWIVSDNLRKGAATNAIQIAEYMHAHAYFQSQHQKAAIRDGVT
jgi:aspartate-semialdehyde dehydrogenase